jgi:uncharacterized protein DUF6484
MRAMGQMGECNDAVSVARRVDGVVIGGLVGLTEEGAPLVDFPGNPHDRALVARMTAPLSPDDIGREVALLFEDGDPSRPILVGAIVAPAIQKSPVRYAVHDGERLELTAQREIVLRCGAASITLTRAGKIVIRGAYVSSHSTGVNRIKGGAVHIN